MRVVLTTTAMLVSLLAVSVAMADSPPPVTAQPKTVCMEVYQPVCGTTAGKWVTYSNSCFAKVAGATDIKDGPCGPSDDAPIKR